MGYGPLDVGRHRLLKSRGIDLHVFVRGEDVTHRCKYVDDTEGREVAVLFRKNEAGHFYLDEDRRASVEIAEGDDICVRDIPWEWEEPVGVIEFGDPIMVGPDGDGFWFHQGGGGVRTTNRDVIYGGAIVSCFFVSGYTYHPECGAREGRAPRLDEVTQDGVAKMLGAIYQWLPTDLPLGQYTRPGLNGFAVKWTDGDTDSKVGHAYGVITGNVQHVVVPMPSASWRGFEPVPGWRLDAVGPVPYLARFVRE